eukprot:UN22373
MVVMRDENAPQKSRSAYMFFCDKNREKVVKNNPDYAMTEVMTALGKMWTETSDKVRTPFVNQAAKSKSKFDKEMEKYRQTPEFTEFQKRRNVHMLIQKYVNQIDGAKKKYVYKVFPTDPNKPKQPSSSYFLFANDNRNALMKKNPDASLAEIGKLLGEAWKKASASAKSKYAKQTQKLKEKYDTMLQNIKKQRNRKKYLALREEYLAERKKMNSKQSVTK